jgi:hypothetical protein
MQAALQKSKPDLVLSVSREDLRDLINLVNRLQRRAQNRQNTFVGKDWHWIAEQTAEQESDSALLSSLKAHLRIEFALIEGLALITKLKQLVALFKRSGLNNQLPIRLKQEVQTRWNSILYMLQSFFQDPDQIEKVLSLCLQFCFLLH